MLAGRVSNAAASSAATGSVAGSARRAIRRLGRQVAGGAGRVVARHRRRWQCAAAALPPATSRRSPGSSETERHPIREAIGLTLGVIVPSA